MPVAAAVEPVADLLAGGGTGRAGAAQRGEAGLAADPGGVVPRGDQQVAATWVATPCLARNCAGAA